MRTLELSAVVKATFSETVEVYNGALWNWKQVRGIVSMDVECFSYFPIRALDDCRRLSSTKESISQKSVHDQNR
ncbi:hypothetical protein NCS52_00820200 [Fusarium sp. LHS14.1]|nr:hypothetical protein NCS52_00820200 [Fusarium sp. LHS14.1]